MIISEEPLKIIEVKGGKAVVSMKRFSICVDCALMIFPPQTQVFEIWVDDNVQVKEGDSAIAGIPEGKIVLYAFILYIFPLIGLFGGLTLAYIIHQRLVLPLGKVPLEFLLGFAGLFSPYFFIRRFDRFISQKKSYLPIVIKKVKIKERLLNKSLLNQF